MANSLLDFLTSLPARGRDVQMPVTGGAVSQVSRMQPAIPWRGTALVDPETAARLRNIDYLQGLKVPYGKVQQYVSPDITQYVGIRDFVRNAGVEDFLGWDANNRQVLLGGYNVPYAFGYQGRTYADPKVLAEILLKVLAQKGFSNRTAKPAANVGSVYPYVSPQSGTVAPPALNFNDLFIRPSRT